MIGPKELLNQQTAHNQNLIQMVKNIQQEKNMIQQQLDYYIGEYTKLSESEQKLKYANILLKDKYDKLEDDYKIAIKHNDQLIQQLEEYEQLLKEALKGKRNEKLLKTVEQLDMSQSQRVYEESKIIDCSDDLKFFENFYMIALACNPNTKQTQQNIIFQYPLNEQQSIVGLDNQIPMFCCREYSFTLLQQNQRSEIYRILKQEIQITDIQIQLFTPSRASGKIIENNIVQQSNPDQFLYALSVESDDFIAEKRSTSTSEIVQLKKLGISQAVYRTKVTYVFLSYLPFMRFFQESIIQIIKVIKMRRLDLLEQSLNIDMDLRSIDALYFVSMKQEIEEYLRQLQLTQISIPSKMLLFDGQLFSFPKLQPQMNQFVGAPFNLFHGWKCSQLMNIFAEILIESKVVIIGYSQIQISYLMLFFNCAIKPLTYPHPFILNVPQQLYPLIDAPVPVFLGMLGVEIQQTDVVLAQAQYIPIKIQNRTQMHSKSLNRLTEQVQPLLEKIQNLTPINQGSFPQLLEGMLNLCKGFIQQEIIKGGDDIFSQRVRSTQLYQLYK
ncbi:hypothetical protein pb186bvf_009833 [Paramecium bursaria]